MFYVMPVIFLRDASNVLCGAQNVFTWCLTFYVISVIFLLFVFYAMPVMFYVMSVMFLRGACYVFHVMSNAFHVMFVTFLRDACNVLRDV
jgi:hypothetical protein